jgi:hypothetical protein
MSKQLSPRSYRKIWEDHYGPIPRDKNGRSYEIHHIDGDHSNCDISNLKLVTIQEHYDLHYAQGDWAACLRMSYRMNLTFDQISELSSRNQRERVAKGIHNWQGPDHNKRLIKDGIHPFLDGEAARQRNLKRVANGTHNLLTDANPSKILAKAGKHHFQLNNPAKAKSKEGTLPSQIKLSCIHCKKQCSLNNFNKRHGNCRG